MWGLVTALLSFTCAGSTAAQSPGHGLLGVGMLADGRRVASGLHREVVVRSRSRIDRFRALELEAVIRRVFGRHGDQAVRIARCESSLDPSAINKKEDARGLFQIRKAAWGETRQRHKDRLDPLVSGLKQVAFNNDLDIQIEQVDGSLFEKLYQVRATGSARGVLALRAYVQTAEAILKR